jgi:hypothetical protein
MLAPYTQYKQPDGHSQPLESMVISQPRGASLSANADGSADDEQAGTPRRDLF